jgi:hypothetical protein
MKVFNVLLILFIYLNISACSEQKSDKKYDKIVINNTKDTISNRASIEKTVLGFLKWYKDNEDRLGQIHLIKGGLEDTTTNYSFDFTATKEYLTELKKSGYLSDIFINNLEKRFVKGEEYLKKHPQNDGPIYGFDADLIMKCQDCMDLWSNLDNAKILNKDINNDKAYLKLEFGGYYKTKYFLTKRDGLWLLDNIINDFSGEE